MPQGDRGIGSEARRQPWHSFCSHLFVCFCSGLIYRCFPRTFVSRWHPNIQEEGEEELPLEAALHCVLAAFRALQGPGRELQTDEAAFVSALYRRMPDLLRPENGDASGRKTVQCVALVYDCLDAALGKRRELSTARVAAMIKRLLSISLQLTQVSERERERCFQSSVNSATEWSMGSVTMKCASYGTGGVCVHS